jgi:hypothetical protein
MSRIASAVLVGGVLLMFWVAAPAAPTPATLPPSPADLAAVDAAVPVAQDVAREAARLRQLLDHPPDPPRPGRDPFKFGVPPTHATPPPPAPPPTAAAPAGSSAPALPVLVAIVDGDAGTRRAAFAIGDDVEVLAAGDAVGLLTIHAIAADHVDLTDAAGKLVTISLK